MANEYRTLESHSAEYFGETRDHWWNPDFLRLMGTRLAFEGVRDVLDVGCGVGHWGQLLTTVLPPEVRLQGVDRDPLWIERATLRATARGLAERFRCCAAAAEELPFADASFDLVTCQTLLIHTRDPGAVVDEMIRVAQPGGLILASEPNNVARALILDSLTFDDPVDDILARARLQLVCERGKAALGEGNNSVGDIVPGLFAERGLDDIQVFLNDKVNALLPPYGTAEQRAMVEEQDDLSGRDFWIWSRQDTRRYFLAGGGRDGEFDALWSLVKDVDERFGAAVAHRSYAGAGASIGYLIAARKRQTV